MSPLRFTNWQISPVTSATTNTPATGWAWIAGASDGFGRALAEACAEAGYPVLLIARRSELLRNVCAHIEAKFGVATHAVTMDLAQEGLVEILQPMLTTHPPAIAIYNAAYVPIGPLTEQPLEELQQSLQVNTHGPLAWCWLVAKAMQARTPQTQTATKSIVLMSSLAGNQGAPNLATYAATKAFNTILAEGLWAELRNTGIQVLVCTAGAIGNANLSAVASKPAPGTLAPKHLARDVLSAIRTKQSSPRLCPGWINKIADRLLGRWLPRRWSITVMGQNTQGLSAADTITHTPSNSATRVNEETP